MTFGHLPTHVPFAMLITLMVGRKKCPQCTAPFYQCLYERFNLQAAMPQHWEYMFNTPNRRQAWGTNMKWIWNVNMSIIT